MHDIQPIKPIAIFATNDSGDQEFLQELLDGHFFGRWKALEGCYNGEVEKSYLVVLHDEFHDLAVIERMAEGFDQECFMVCDTERYCRLVYMDRERPAKHIGQLREVPKFHAVLQSDYSYDPETKKYWVCS